MLNINKLFEAAAAAGIKEFEARILAESSLSVSMFDGERENYTVSDHGKLKIRGLYGGKSGVFTSDRVDDDVIDTAIAALKSSAEYGNPYDPEFFISGGKYAYEKVDCYNAELESTDASEYIGLAKALSVAALGSDGRVEHAEISVEYNCSTMRLVNSNGLDLEQRGNYVTVGGSVKVSEGGEVQSGSRYEILSSLGALDADGFVKELIADGVGQLGGGTVQTGRYPVVYSPDCVAVLVKTLSSGFSAFAAEQHVSLLEGKMGKALFSDMFNVEQTPIGNEVFCSAFDAEGVPCKNRMLIKDGVPTGYVYDLGTAKRAGATSTGNGRLIGGNIRPAVDFVTVHCGALDRDGMFKKINSGIYITSLGGTSTGIDAQSGNYSLQASGYMIDNGKISAPISLMTVAGNILTDFADIVAVGNDSKLTYYGVKTPSIAIGGLAVSGVNADNRI